MEQERFDPAAIRVRLSQFERRRQQWRSLEELAEQAEGQPIPAREFPRQAPALPGGIDRRHFLKLMGAAMALAGLSGCTPRAPREKIIPYVHQPEEIVPGKPLFFATAMTMGGFATGVLVESHQGRPTKVEGNPDHPASLGATDPFAQAWVLALYDPDRSRQLIHLGKRSPWEEFLTEMNAVLEVQRAREGAGLRVLTETVTSPTLAGQLEALLERFPRATWHQFEPVARDNLLEGARLAFGEALNTIYRFEVAEVILALDADFLTTFPGSVRYAREFINGRRVRAGRTEMNRLYAVESTPTNTGAMADHRLPLRAGEIEGFTVALAQALGLEIEAPAGSPFQASEWFTALVRDLQQHRGASLVLPGVEQPATVHALAHAINDVLGNVGRTVVSTPPVVANPVNQTDSLRELVAAMAADEVELLVILGGNPVYTAPADLPFARYLVRIPQSVHLALYPNETSALSTWHIPQQHELESWSDARAFDGTASIIQPLIAPLFESRRSVHELMAVLLGEPDRSGFEIVRTSWEQQVEVDDFERFWQRALHDGVIAGTTPEPVRASFRRGLTQQVAASISPRAAESEGLEIIFRPDPRIWDGRFANNSWLQELPQPLTKLTWGNAALISPATAARLNLANEELVELSYRGRTLAAPIWIMPGHADDSVTLSLGYGRERAGQVGNGIGFNAYSLRTSQAPWFDTGLEMRPTGGRHPLATTQEHQRMEGREPVRVAAIQVFRENPEIVHAGHARPPLPSLYPAKLYEGYAWGMAIDLTACIGCGACVVACQAENNIPTVGKQQVALGREMHWLRIDRYYEGPLSNPATYFQPIPCMHCEKAPCELVCPVEATLHSEEGLNEMVYDRCVGTRYCSNNCPYKVRRFNYFEYVDEIPILRELRNPDVSVRPRGVIEKCTYCVQRINAARIEAKKENRPIRDGEMVPACAAACPTRAIIFGDVSDPETGVARLKDQPHNYGLLAELNTQPRTSYLARLRNPNPELVEG